LGRLFSRRRASCACVVADRPPAAKPAAVTRTSVARGWIRDADRQPSLPRKKMIQRRGIRPTSIPRPHTSAGR
jgi:hypothetical protein